MAKALAATLEDRLAVLKRERGEVVPIDEVGAVVASILATAEETGRTVPQAVGSEIRELLDFIARAKDELAAMRPKTIVGRHIPRACDELDAVVANTEEAAGRFMDVADRMGMLAGDMPGDKADLLQELSTEIFETSSFQDITGQRVGKVVAVLRHIDERLSALAEAIGDSEIHDEEVAALDEAGEVVNEDALKHGPQLAGEGNSQDDIDALFAKLD